MIFDCKLFSTNLVLVYYANITNSLMLNFTVVINMHYNTVIVMNDFIHSWLLGVSAINNWKTEVKSAMGFRETKQFPKGAVTVKV